MKNRFRLFSLPLILLMMAIFPVCSLAASFGKLEIQVPNSKCKIYVDNKYKGHGKLTLKLKAGAHKVKVLENGKMIYKKVITVAAHKYLAIKAYAKSAKKQVSQAEEPLTPEPSVAETPSEESGGTATSVKFDGTKWVAEAPAEGSGQTAQPAHQAAQTNVSQPAAIQRTEQKPAEPQPALYPNAKHGGHWGLSAGVNTALVFNMELGVFYSDDFNEGLRYELSANALVGLATLNGLSSSIIPLEFNLKHRLNDNMTIGGGINYTFWGITGGVISPGLGYQINCEIELSFFGDRIHSQFRQHLG